MLSGDTRPKSGSLRRNERIKEIQDDFVAYQGHEFKDHLVRAVALAVKKNIT